MVPTPSVQKSTLFSDMSLWPSHYPKIHKKEKRKVENEKLKKSISVLHFHIFYYATICRKIPQCAPCSFLLWWLWLLSVISSIIQGKVHGHEGKRQKLRRHCSRGVYLTGSHKRCCHSHSEYFLCITVIL